MPIPAASSQGCDGNPLPHEILLDPFHHAVVLITADNLVGNGFHFIKGIANSDAPIGNLQHRDIIQIVTEHHNSFCSRPCCKFLYCSSLCRTLHIEVDKAGILIEYIMIAVVSTAYSLRINVVSDGTQVAEPSHTEYQHRPILGGISRKTVYGMQPFQLSLHTGRNELFLLRSKFPDMMHDNLILMLVIDKGVVAVSFMIREEYADS